MNHISFSALKIWNECPYKHKLKYLDRLSLFSGNEYTAFGTAIHDTCEKKLLKEKIKDEEHFLKRFEEEISSLVEDKYDIKESLVTEMRQQGGRILTHVEDSLEDYFEDYEVFSSEEEIYVPINENYNFKGFIDVVLKTSDGKYHIMDWKTCSWGWNAKRKSDKMTTYQLTLYKYFFAKKHNVELKDIETHFGLLKRTAKKSNVEIFRVSSGKIKIQNCLKLLEKALHNISNKKFLKNRLACTSGFGCEFYKTKHCP